MNISVFGLGYVGCVSLGCLSKLGHNVIGVDINEQKNKFINSGVPTIIEKDVDILIKEGYFNNTIKATNSVKEAVRNSAISFICVGTPNQKNGHLDLSQIRKVVRDIADEIALKKDFHTIVIRSTVLPGTSEELNDFVADRSKKIPDKDFCILVNPEFLREGNAVYDFFNPPVTVIGGTNSRGINTLMEVYKDIPGEKKIVNIKVAESIKLINNSFHALKVAFINEIGTIAKSLKINTHQLIDLFLLDTKLNISEAYLRPGFAYGGSCLPKDLRALNLIAHDAYLKVPVLNSIEESNALQISRAVLMIEDYQAKNIGFWGISFKDGTDDLRNSPVIRVIENLIGKGYKVSLYDEQVNESKLIGANKEYIKKVLPHFQALLFKNFDEFIEKADLLVINKKGNKKIYKKLLEKKELKILDLKDIRELKTQKNYQGFNW